MGLIELMGVGDSPRTVTQRIAASLHMPERGTSSTTERTCVGILGLDITTIEGKQDEYNTNPRFPSCFPAQAEPAADRPSTTVGKSAAVPKTGQRDAPTWGYS